MNALQSLARDPTRSSTGTFDVGEEQHSDRLQADDAEALANLKQELQEGVDESLSKNMVSFERMVEVQKRQLLEGVKDVVAHQSDRVISTIISGPHDRIIDKVGFEQDTSD
jgi:hypothetical protein